MRIVVLRPEPGAGTTRRRAEAEGWEAVSVPLFRIEARAWSPPEARQFDAVLMTSANAAGEGGPALARYARLPLYAVGEATAKAARGAGFDDIVAGRDGVATIADRLRAEGKRRILHIAGADTRPFDETGLEVARVAVYASEPTEAGALAEALAGEPIVLLHSARAAARFAGLVDAAGIPRDRIALVAISAAALAGAGEGWRAAAAAEHPGDDDMLAHAAELARTLGGGERIG